jgi:hypothetical protein
VLVGVGVSGVSLGISVVGGGRVMLGVGVSGVSLGVSIIGGIEVMLGVGITGVSLGASISMYSLSSGAANTDLAPVPTKKPITRKKRIGKIIKKRRFG